MTFAMLLLGLPQKKSSTCSHILQKDLQMSLYQTTPLGKIWYSMWQSLVHCNTNTCMMLLLLQVLLVMNMLCILNRKTTKIGWNKRLCLSSIHFRKFWWILQRCFRIHPQTFIKCWNQIQRIKIFHSKKY